MDSLPDHGPHWAPPRTRYRPSSRLLRIASLPVLVLLGVGLASSLAGQERPLSATLPVDSAIRIGTLPNGLRYYIQVNHRPENRAELRLAVNAGSILETDAQRGLAHFVEHMAFNGTEHFAKNELVSYLESVGMRFGADLNAYTSFDETVYQLTIPTDSAPIVEKGFQILEDWAHGQAFDSAQVMSERGVVMEEWRLGQGASSRIQKKQFPVLFHGSRYAERLPIGDTATIAAATPAALRGFYQTWYRPELMAVVAVGDFDPDRVEALIRDHFGRIPVPAHAASRPGYPVPPHDSTLVSIATDPEATQSAVSVYFKHPAPSDSTLGDYRRSIVAGLADGMMNRRLYELTQEADPPFLGAYAGNTGLTRTTDAYVMAAGVADGGVLRGLDALLTESERAYRHGFTAGELQREKADVLRSMERAYAEREKSESSSFADEYVRNFLTDEPIPGIAAEYALYQRFLPGITLAEVDSLSHRWLARAGRVVLVQAPEGADLPTSDALLAAFDSIAARDVAAYQDSVNDAPLVAQPPTPGRIVAEEHIDTLGATVWRLSNGATVVLRPTDFKQDQVLLRAFSPGGTSLVADSLYVPGGTAGFIVQNGGVGRFSRVELEKALAGKAVSVAPFIAGREEGLGGSASPRDLDEMFQLAYLYFTSPRADSAAFTSLRSRWQAAVENRDKEPMAVFEDSVQVLMTNHDPRGEPISRSWFARMDLGRSLDIYRQRFADAGDFTFVLVGSFAPDSVRPLVERWIASLPAAGAKEHARDLGIEPPDGIVRRRLVRGIEPKARTRIVFHGPMADSADARYALAALADVLRLRLRDVLRERMGGTYGVSVDGGAVREPRPEYELAIDFGAAPDRLDELTAEVFRQIDSLRSTGPAAQEVEKVRETQRRARETALRQNGYWIGALTRIFREGDDPASFWDDDRRVAGLDTATIRDAARKYLDEKQYVEVSLVPEEGAPGGV